jgi:hypothetical protein
MLSRRIKAVPCPLGVLCERAWLLADFVSFVVHGLPPNSGCASAFASVKLTSS